MTRWFSALVLALTSASSLACSPGTGSEAPSSTAADVARAQPAAESPAATPTARAQTCDAGSFVAALPVTLPRMQTETDLDSLKASLTGCAGIGRLSSVSGSRPTLMVELATPLDASEVAGALGVPGAHVITTTVHQESFHLARSARSSAAADLSIDDDLRFGSWDLRVITKRPSGPLPSQRFGPAPAYDLARYRTQVTHIAIAVAR